MNRIRLMTANLLAAAMLLAYPAFGGQTKTQLAETSFSALTNKAFVKVDSQTGLFRNAGGLFVLPCVTYVQTSKTTGGFNNGLIQILAMDPVKLRPDFRQMRQAGVRGIYMRIGPGLFLNPDGSWRKPQDPFTGVINAGRVQTETLARLAQAAKAGIGPFTYNYELFDYLLDCASTEGIYVVPAILDPWDFPFKYDLRESYVCIDYDAIWERTMRDWAKILTRYKDRKVILGYLMEGEFLNMPVWSERQMANLAPGGPKIKDYPSPLEAQDPEVKRSFQDYLQRRYGTIDELKNHWRYGYDRANPSYDPQTGVPHYSFKAGMFGPLAGFSQVALPTVERSRLDKDLTDRGNHCPYWGNVPSDPEWIDFAYFKDWLYTSRLNELFRRIRQVDPNHLIVHDAAGDFVPPWHPFYVPWNHGELDADVILHGNGYPEVVITKDISKPVSFIRPETIKEVYQTVAPYRPFKRGSNGAAKAFGMGEGGLDLEASDPNSRDFIIPEELQDRWITSILMDDFGSGGAFASLWDWSSITAITRANPKIHEHLATRSMAQLTRAIERDTFTRGRRARVLILANGPALHSLLQPLEYSNVITLSSALAATHCPFDTVSSDEIVLGAKAGKVDLNQYDAILIPQQNQIPQQQLNPMKAVEGQPSIWKMLDPWLAAKPNRVLCVGMTVLHDAYFTPLEELPAGVAQVLGQIEPGPLGTPIRGEKTWKMASGGQLTITIDGARTQTLGISAKDSADTKPFLTDGDKVVGVERACPNGSAVYTFGFPLGLSWTPLMEPLGTKVESVNVKMDESKLAAFYEALIARTGIAPDFKADPSIVAYISDRAKVVLIRQRFEQGMRQGVTLASPHFTGQIYAGATTTVNRAGSGALGTAGTIVCDLGKTNYAAMLTQVGKAKLAKNGSVAVEVTPSPAEGKPVTYQVKVTGKVAAQIVFEPGLKPASLDYVPSASGTTLTLSSAPSALEPAAN